MGSEPGVRFVLLSNQLEVVGVLSHNYEGEGQEDDTRLGSLRLEQDSASGNGHVLQLCLEAEDAVGTGLEVEDSQG